MQPRFMKVYVIELDEHAPLPSSLGTRRPFLYVGITFNTPERRFEIHKRGGRTASRIVFKHGVRLRPDLYERYEQVPVDRASAFEQTVAKALRAEGYVVDAGSPGFGWSALQKKKATRRTPTRRASRYRRSDREAVQATDPLSRSRRGE